VGITREFHLNN